jgi:hypothetical protein
VTNGRRNDTQRDHGAGCWMVRIVSVVVIDARSG